MQFKIALNTCLGKAVVLLHVCQPSFNRSVSLHMRVMGSGRCTSPSMRSSASAEHQCKLHSPATVPSMCGSMHYRDGLTCPGLTIPLYYCHANHALIQSLMLSQDKILQSVSRDQKVTVTNDGATILKSLYVDNPAAKVLVGKLSAHNLTACICCIRAS